MCAGGSAKRLVAISPSLQPTTIKQSDASIRSLAMREYRPKRPILSGLAQAMPPLPLIVCATGIECASAKRVSASQASDK